MLADFWPYALVVAVSMIPPICIGLVAYFSEAERNRDADLR